MPKNFLPIRAPFIPPEEIAERAHQFLEEHHPSGDIPIPIEDITEIKLGIHITPLPGIKDSLVEIDSDTDGFISSDLKEITIDKQMFQHSIKRTKFTVAHELGHAVLHKNFYSRLLFSSVEEWIKVSKSIEEYDYTWIERHANAFAGLVLVPTKQLRLLTYQIKPDAVKEVKRYMKNKPINLDEAVTITILYLSKVLSDNFQASSETVGIRLKKEKLVTRGDFV